LSLTCDFLVSKLAFKFNLYCYTEEVIEMEEIVAWGPVPVAAELEPPVGRVALTPGCQIG
jgi:hypothetical protein